MESKTTKKRFCSDKCRVYWNRENPNGVVISPIELEKKIKEAKKKPIEEVFDAKPITYSYFDKKPQIMLLNSNPEPPAGLTGIDLAIWKSENWK